MGRALSFSSSFPSQSAGGSETTFIIMGQTSGATDSTTCDSGSCLVVSVIGAQIRNTLISPQHILPLDFNVSTGSSVPKEQEGTLQR